jgi:hypothetical protein
MLFRVMRRNSFGRPSRPVASKRIEIVDFARDAMSERIGNRNHLLHLIIKFY